MLKRIFERIFGKNSYSEAWLWSFAWLPAFHAFNRFRATVLRAAGAKVGKGCRIQPGFHAKGVHLISIGADSSLNRNVSLQASNGVRLEIGRDCLIGENVVIRNANHNFDNPDCPIRMQGNTGAEVVVGDDVWIASNAVVLPGAHIGRGSVIGAGAVVKGEIPPYSVAVGVPARVVKSRKRKESETQLAGDPRSGVAAA